MGKKVIRLTESDIENIVKKIISEQNERVLVNRLNEKIQSVMIEKQEEILNNSKVVITSKNPEDPYNNPMILKIAKSIITVPYIGRTENLPTWLNDNLEPSVYTVGSIPLSTYYTDIWEGDDDLKRYYDGTDYIREQMDSMNVPLKLTVTPPSDVTVRQWANKRKNRKGKKPYVNTNEIPLGDFFAAGGAKFNYLGSALLFVQIGGLTMKLGGVEIFPPAPPEGGGGTVPPPITAPKKIKLDLVDVFNYDKITLKDKDEYQLKLNEFKTELADGIQNINGFKDFLNSQTLTVYGYASQDADPNEADGGRFTGCSTYGKGKGPRKDYNICLSNARAEKVKNDIQTIFTELGLTTTINSEGKGETYRWGGNGWSDTVKDIESDLSKNRRVIFDIPEYKTKQ